MVAGERSYLVTFSSIHRMQEKGDRGIKLLLLKVTLSDIIPSSKGSITLPNSTANWGQSVQTHELTGNCSHSNHHSGLKNQFPDYEIENVLHITIARSQSFVCVCVHGCICICIYVPMKAMSLR